MPQGRTTPILISHTMKDYKCRDQSTPIRGRIRDSAGSILVIRYQKQIAWGDKKINPPRQRQQDCFWPE